VRAVSQYPNRAEAWQFFDYRNGFVLGPEDRIVAALPGRLQVLDPATLDIYFDIPTDRYEQEPMNLFFSARDSKIYVRPNNNSRLLIQVDALRGVLSDVPLERGLRADDLASLPVEISASAAQRQGYRTPLMRLLLGDLVWGFPNNRFWGLIPRGLIPFQVTIIDYLTPPSSSQENILLLVRVDNPFSGESAFFLSRAVNQAILSPNGETLLLRHAVNGDERISAFEALSGRLAYRFTPSLRAIGGYSRTTRNRVLAYTADGQQLISDFQRYSADQGQVIVEDLRYSRRFDRFFFTEDGQRVVTLSGTEWREWDASRGEVLRREVVNLSSLIATSRDGYRFLSLRRGGSFGTVDAVVEILDLNNGARRTDSVPLERLRGSVIDNVIFNADWTRFLAIYSPNPYGPYGEGNQIAYYALGQGQLWHMAGDDLPPPYNREYRFVDDETVLIRGEGFSSDQTARVFGVDYSTQGGLPACLVQRFPQQVERWSALWEQLIARLRDDQLNRLALFICQQDLTDSSAALALLVLTATPLPVTPTPVVLDGVPVCLTFAYSERAEQVGALWRDITRDLDDSARAEMEALMCQGIGEVNAEVLARSDEQYQVQSFLIGADGVRRSGDVPPPSPRPNLLEPLRREFYRATERDFGQAILNADATRLLSSTIPGELVIYRLVSGIATLEAWETATRTVELATLNPIFPQPSPTPTLGMIGTARPTLTPTTTPTPIPQVGTPYQAESRDFCPSQTLFTPDNLPSDFAPTGRFYATFEREPLWTINPLTGQRAPDETIPQCQVAISCSFSPDGQWILAEDSVKVYVMRPDGSDERVLYEKEKTPRISYTWAGAGILEFPTQVELRDAQGQIYYVDAIGTDILGVFPDPEPWIPRFRVNELPAEILNRQPGGDWLVARLSYSTGTGLGYRYYLGHRTWGTAEYFARSQVELNFGWNPLGQAAYYGYDANYDQGFSGPPGSFGIFALLSTGQRERLPDNVNLDLLRGGTWSYDGQRVARFTLRGAQVEVYDASSQVISRYCVPRSPVQGALPALYGPFWSPDGRYLAYMLRPAQQGNQGKGLVVLDLATGNSVLVSEDVVDVIAWVKEAGSYE